MKTSFIITAAFLLVSSFSQASTPPEAVPGLDKTREGNLQSKVIEFYKNSVAQSCDDSIGFTTYSAEKLSSDSAMNEKMENSTMTYSAVYLVISVCNTGSTYAGAYREVMSGAIVKAERFGTVKNGGSPLIPTEPDVMKIVRELDPALLKL